MLFHLEMLNINALLAEHNLKSQLYFINEGHYNSILVGYSLVLGIRVIILFQREVGDSP